MKTLLFSPATCNLAETSRCIEVAKAVKHLYNIVFMGFGGDYEELITQEGFHLEKIYPRLTPEKIKHIYQIDQGEKYGQMFTKEEIRSYVTSEIKVINEYKPSAIITGFDFAANISSRATGTPVIWLTQSTWSIKQMIQQGLGDYADDFDRPLLRLLPISVKRWLTSRMIDVLGLFILKPFNKVAAEFKVSKFSHIESLWEGDYNLLAEPEGFSGNTMMPESYHYIGPLIAKINTPVPEEVMNIPRDKPLIYFAMGSSGKPQIIKNIIEGFADQPFNVVTPVKRKLKELNVEVPDNVYVTDLLPALEVSKLADLSVIHGGVGTVMTAALAGRPVVGIGMMYEQEYNIECLVRKGFAKRISRYRFTPDTLNSAIMSQLDNQNAKDNALSYQKEIEKCNTAERLTLFFTKNF